MERIVARRKNEHLKKCKNEGLEWETRIHKNRNKKSVCLRPQDRSENFYEVGD
jgi:hypothetical protein